MICVWPCIIFMLLNAQSKKRVLHLIGQVARLLITDNNALSSKPPSDPVVANWPCEPLTAANGHEMAAPSPPYRKVPKGCNSTLLLLVGLMYVFMLIIPSKAQLNCVQFAYRFKLLHHKVFCSKGNFYI